MRSDYSEMVERSKAEQLSIGDKLKVEGSGNNVLAEYVIVKLESKDGGVKVYADSSGDEE